MRRSFFRFSIPGLTLAALLLIAVRGEGAQYPAYNTVAVDVPFDGGAFASYSRMWRMGRYVDAGFFAGAGDVENHFQLQRPDGSNVDARTQTVVAPFIGPKLSFNFPFVAISLGYGFFWAKTDLSVDWPGQATLRGTTSGWGQGIYSPLLVLDFLDQKHNVFWGVGIGGLFATRYPDLEASNDNLKISTDQKPLDNLTFHVHLLWSGISRPARASNGDF